jgi:isocitrate lyase
MMLGMLDEGILLASHQELSYRKLNRWKYIEQVTTKEVKLCLRTTTTDKKEVGDGNTDNIKLIMGGDTATTPRSSKSGKSEQLK